MLTDIQLQAAANARDAINLLDSWLPGEIAAINASTALPWMTDATVFFEVLGTRAAGLWRANGARIDTAMHQGAPYTALRKPDKICVVCEDGNIVVSPVDFPVSTPLANWAASATDKTAGLALIAQGEAAVMAALMATQSQAGA